MNEDSKMIGILAATVCLIVLIVTLGCNYRCNKFVEGGYEEQINPVTNQVLWVKVKH